MRFQQRNGQRTRSAEVTVLDTVPLPATNARCEHPEDIDEQRARVLSPNLNAQTGGGDDIVTTRGVRESTVQSNTPDIHQYHFTVRRLVGHYHGLGELAEDCSDYQWDLATRGDNEGETSPQPVGSWPKPQSNILSWHAPEDCLSQNTVSNNSQGEALDNVGNPHLT